MSRHGLHVIVRTPREVVVELDVDSLRVPTDSGQLGIRRRAEATVAAIEPGLVLGRAGAQQHFIATAGGLLHMTGLEVVLLTPIAVVGDDAAAVVAAVDAALAKAAPERELRQAIERLETGLLREVRGGGDGR